MIFFKNTILLLLISSLFSCKEDVTSKVSIIESYKKSLLECALQDLSKYNIKTLYIRKDMVYDTSYIVLTDSLRNMLKDNLSTIPFSCTDIRRIEEYNFKCLPFDSLTRTDYGTKPLDLNNIDEVCNGDSKALIGAPIFMRDSTLAILKRQIICAGFYLELESLYEFEAKHKKWIITHNFDHALKENLDKPVYWN